MIVWIYCSQKTIFILRLITADWNINDWESKQNLYLYLYLYLKLPLSYIYHAIFSSHMRYACQVWGLCDNVACHLILTLQKCALRLITYSAPRTSSNPISSDLGILKFFNLVEVLNILFVHQLFNWPPLILANLWF